MIQFKHKLSISLLRIQSAQPLLRSNNPNCLQLAGSRIDTRSVLALHFSAETIVSLDLFLCRILWY